MTTQELAVSCRDLLGGWGLIPGLDFGVGSPKTFLPAFLSSMWGVVQLNVARRRQDIHLRFGAPWHTTPINTVTVPRAHTPCQLAFRDLPARLLYDVPNSSTIDFIKQV